MEKRKLGAHRPPPNSRGDSSLCTGAQHALRDSPLTCSHTLGTEQITANDMVPAQWERPLNSRQDCQSKAVRSTYNFLPPFQGQKVDVRKLLFTKSVLSYGALKDFSEIPQCLYLRKSECEDDLRHSQVGNDFG